MQDAGFGMQVSGCKFRDAGCRMQFMVQNWDPKTTARSFTDGEGKSSLTMYSLHAQPTSEIRDSARNSFGLLVNDFTRADLYANA